MQVHSPGQNLPRCSRSMTTPQKHPEFSLPKWAACRSCKKGEKCLGQLCDVQKTKRVDAGEAFVSRRAAENLQVIRRLRREYFLFVKTKITVIFILHQPPMLGVQWQVGNAIPPQLSAGKLDDVSPAHNLSPAWNYAPSGPPSYQAHP
jgi:hypothetical protein